MLGALSQVIFQKAQFHISMVYGQFPHSNSCLFTGAWLNFFTLTFRAVGMQKSHCIDTRENSFSAVLGGHTCPGNMSTKGGHTPPSQVPYDTQEIQVSLAKFKLKTRACADLTHTLAA